MRKKSAFTIVEFIIVMTIITIMFLLTRNYFTNESKIYYAGESCINNMFYTLKDLNNAALLGRTRSLSWLFLSGGNNIQTPDWYTILLRQPSYYENPQFSIPLDGVSGMVQSLIADPANASVLGLYGWQSLRSPNLISRSFLYRGTGNIYDDLDYTGDAYEAMYLPLRGINYTANPYYTPVKGCASRDFFITYTISTPYADINTLRIGFQNTSSDSDKKMLIQPGQWMSGAVADANTGAIIFRVCNQWVECKESHRLFFDTRVNDMFLQKCAQYGTPKRCSLWQGGNIN